MPIFIRADLMCSRFSSSFHSVVVDRFVSLLKKRSKETREPRNQRSGSEAEGILFRQNPNENPLLMTPIILCSRQRAAVRARPGETGRLRCGRSADGYADQEGNLCGDAVLDGSRGHPAVCLRLQGKCLAVTYAQQMSLP